MEKQPEENVCFRLICHRVVVFWLVYRMVGWLNKTVLCKLMHLLSCSFNTRKRYDNPDAGLTSCCVNFHQASSASLTREQKYMVDRMVEAHRLYRAQDSGHSRVGHSVETLGCTSKRTHLHFSLTLPSWFPVCVCSAVWVAVHRRRGGLVWCRVAPPAKTATVCQDSSR